MNKDSQKSSVTIAWALFTIVLIGSLLLEKMMEPHPHFGFDGWTGFFAAFGFASCLAIVFVSKFLGMILKRKEDYYGEDQ